MNMMEDDDDMIGNAYGIGGLPDELIEDPTDFAIPIAQVLSSRTAPALCSV